jgi:hypothetical protein
MDLVGQYLVEVGYSISVRWANPLASPSQSDWPANHCLHLNQVGQFFIVPISIQLASTSLSPYLAGWPAYHCPHIYLVGQSQQIMVPYLSSWLAHHCHYINLVGQHIIVPISIWLANLSKSWSHIYLVG